MATGRRQNHIVREMLFAITHILDLHLAVEVYQPRTVYLQHPAEKLRNCASYLQSQHPDVSQRYQSANGLLLSLVEQGYE